MSLQLGKLGQMLHVKIGALKNGLSAFLRKVKAGESVTVNDRDTPIAKIEPNSPAATQPFKNDRERIASLVARGILEAPKDPKVDPSIFEGPLPKAKASVLEALLEERREGR